MDEAQSLQPAQRPPSRLTLQLRLWHQLEPDVGPLRQINRRCAKFFTRHTSSFTVTESAPSYDVYDIRDNFVPIQVNFKHKKYNHEHEQAMEDWKGLWHMIVGTNSHALRFFVDIPSDLCVCTISPVGLHGHSLPRHSFRAMWVFKKIGSPPRRFLPRAPQGSSRDDSSLDWGLAASVTQQTLHSAAGILFVIPHPHCQNLGTLFKGLGTSAGMFSEIHTEFRREQHDSPSNKGSPATLNQTASSSKGEDTQLLTVDKAYSTYSNAYDKWKQIFSEICDRRSQNRVPSGEVFKKACEESHNMFRKFHRTHEVVMTEIKRRRDALKETQKITKPRCTGVSAAGSLAVVSGSGYAWYVSAWTLKVACLAGGIGVALVAVAGYCAYQYFKDPNDEEEKLKEVESCLRAVEKAAKEEHLALVLCYLQQIHGISLEALDSRVGEFSKVLKMHGVDSKELHNRRYQDSLLDSAEASLQWAHQNLLTSITHIL